MYQQKVEEDEDLSLAEVLPEKDKIRPLLFDIDLSVAFEGAVGQMRTSSSVRQLTSEDQTERETCTRNDFEPTRSNTPGWSGPKDQQNKTDIFLSVYGVMHVIIGSKKSKGKEMKEWMIYLKVL